MLLFYCEKTCLAKTQKVLLQRNSQVNKVSRKLGVNVKIAGVILAGGQSTRMGEDKATLTMDQHTLLARAVALLKTAGFDDCFVSGDYQGFNCILDQQACLGPIAGIAACASHLSERYDAMFIIPVDMPLLAPQDCEYLLQYFSQQFITQQSTNEDESNPLQASCHLLTRKQGVYYKQATFPMLLSLNKTLLDYLAEVVTSPHKKHRSLYRLLETLDIKGVDQKDVDAFRFENTNTPEQWQRCLATYTMMQSKLIIK